MMRASKRGTIERALRGEADGAIDRILRGSFWSSPAPASRVATVTALRSGGGGQAGAATAPR